MEDTDVPLFPEAPAVTVERTLAIIKPDAIHFADEIVEEIKTRGFTITQVRSHPTGAHVPSSIARPLDLSCKSIFSWSGWTPVAIVCNVIHGWLLFILNVAKSIKRWWLANYFMSRHMCSDWCTYSKLWKWTQLRRIILSSIYRLSPLQRLKQ